MKILKLVLIIVGIVLVLMGFLNALGLQEVLEQNAVGLSPDGELNNQIFGMIGLGIIALIAGAFLNMKRK